MYVAKLSNTYVLKRMPGTGYLHTAHCESYEPPSELSGLGEMLGTAIIEDPNLGTTTLKLGFPLQKIPGRLAPTPNSDASVASVKADGKRLGFKSLLHYLWESAGFNRWTPRMKDKRSWGVIHKYLLEALSLSLVKQLSLSQTAYIPPRWTDESSPIAIENEMRRKERWIKAAQFEEGKRQLLILIGEVKDISESRYGFAMAIKQIPHVPFYLDADLHRKLTKHFENELTLRSAFPNGHLMVIGTFGVNDALTPKFEELALMYVDSNWLPVESLAEAALTTLLVNQDRSFAKGMRYNLSNQKPLASAVLSDADQLPVALYLTPANATPIFIEAQQELINSSNLKSWIWDLNQSIPALPPLNHHKDQTSQEGY